MKGFIKTFFVISLCLAAVSCSDLSSPSNEETAPLPSPAEGTIRFDIEKKDRLSRAAVPQAFLNGFYYQLTVYKADDVDSKVVTKYQKTLSFTVPAPSWTGASVARLEMFCPTTDQVTTDGDGVLTVSSDVCMTGHKSFNLVDGTRVFNFTIDLEIADAETKGTINLPVTVGNTGVKSCIIVPDYAGSDTSKYIKAKIENGLITCSDVTPFSDHALFYFFKADVEDLPGTLTNTLLDSAVVMYSDSITVFPNTTTDKWFGSDGVEKNVDLDSLQYSTMYVASNGDDKNGGSSLYPVKKLSTAIARCAQAENGGTIYLKSQPGDTEKIVIDKKVKIEKLSTATGVITLPDIEIKDFSSETAVSLKGVKISASGKTGITVGKKCSLTLDNVEVSGCEKGIYAEKECTVNLTNSTDSTKPSVVKDCTGYGIQLKNSSGILKINGKDVNSDKVATSTFDSCDLYYPYGKVVRLNTPCSDVSKNDDILKEAFNAVGGFGNGSVLLLGKTTSTSVTWEIKENGISVTTGTSGNTYTVKPVNSNCNVAIKRDSGASNQFVLLKSTAYGTWKISNFTFKDGSNTTQTDASLNSDGKGGAVYLKNGTLDLTSCSFANNSAQNGGAVYIESGTVILDACTIGGSSTAVNTAAENGGAFYLEGSSAKLVMNSGTIGNNTATLNGGAVYLAGASTSLEMNNGAISSNTAVNGGGVYVAADAAAEIKGGRIISNSATTAGGAVYQSGTFKVSGYTYITPGSAPKSNDVYLASGKYVEVTDSLTPKEYGSSNGADVSYTAAITPSTWKRGTQVLTGTYAASNYGKFKGSESDWDTVSDTDDNKVKLYTSYIIYVAGSSPASGIETGKSAADGGLGTKAKPYASIEEAVKACWNEKQAFTVYLSGSLNGSAQTVPAKDTVNKTGLAKSITLEGVTGNTEDIINRNLTGDPGKTGTALTINTATPVTIKKIKITGGYRRKGGSGGGIYLSQKGAALTLGEGVLITGNSAAYGGGIYFAGTSASDGTATLTMESTAQISGNTALNESKNVGFGGGVYLDYANLCMSGSALIGDTTGSGAAEESSKSNSAISGGGVYGRNGSNVYIGYKKISETDPNYPVTCGILHNYSSGNGGGIYSEEGNVYLAYGAVSRNGAVYDGGGVYVSSGSVLNMNSGDIAFNKAGNSSYKGGGIYSAGSVIITKGRILGNSADTGGGIYNDGFFWLKDGIIGAEGAVNQSSSTPQGIYNTQSATFKVSGAPDIYSGNKVICNSPIQVAGSLNGTGYVFTFTPNNYNIGTAVVKMADGVSNPSLSKVAGRFKLEDSTDKTISASGTIISTSTTFSTSAFKDYYQSLPINTPETPIKITIAGVSTISDFYDLMYDNKLTDRYIDISFEGSTFTAYAEKGASGSRYVGLTLPSTCNTVTLNDFSGSNLKEIRVSSSNTAFKTVDGVLYSNDGKTLVWYPGKRNSTSYTVLTGTETIGSYAFNNSSVLESLTISTGVKTMEKRCLESCSAITYLSLPSSLTTIGDYAIWCSKLKSISIPAGVTTIGTNAFEGSSNLESISVNSSNSSFKIKDGILYSKDGKTIVVCPAKLSKTSYIIPSDVTKICCRAFYYTSFKTAITFDSNSLTGWHQIDEYGVDQGAVEATQTALNEVLCSLRSLVRSGY